MMLYWWLRTPLRLILYTLISCEFLYQSVSMTQRNFFDEVWSCPNLYIEVYDFRGQFDTKSIQQNNNRRVITDAYEFTRWLLGQIYIKKQVILL